MSNTDTLIPTTRGDIVSGVLAGFYSEADFAPDRHQFAQQITNAVGDTAVIENPYLRRLAASETYSPVADIAGELSTLMSMGVTYRCRNGVGLHDRKSLDEFDAGLRKLIAHEIEDTDQAEAAYQEIRVVGVQLGQTALRIA